MRKFIALAVLGAAVAVPALATQPAFADQPTTGSICGTTWQDLNGDGIREANEPAEANDYLGVANTDAYDTQSDANGNYCITGLPFGTYQVQFNDLSPAGLSYTRQTRDSAANWATGTTGDINVGVNGAPAVVDNVDEGYEKASVDAKTEKITINGRTVTNGCPAPSYQVGDVLKIEGVDVLHGNAPSELFAGLTLPAGLQIISEFGSFPLDQGGGQTISGAYYDRMNPGTRADVGAYVKVTEPLTDATITLTATGVLWPDPNPANNTLTTTITATN